jgi:hypothetical protein
MRSKKELNALNRRREINRRLTFVKKRMDAAPVELAFAFGRLEKMPAHSSVPPDLALAAARLSWKTGFGPLAKITGDAREKLKGRDVWEIFGMYRAMYAFAHDRITAACPGSEKWALAQLKRHVARGLSKSFLRWLGKLEARFKISVPAPSLEALIEQGQRSTAGLSSFVTPAGEMPTMKTATARIYHNWWFFWPSLEGRWTAPALHSWLAQELDERVSDKLVERLLTSLRREAERIRSAREQP